jgi:hypothetical protein
MGELDSCLPTALDPAAVIEAVAREPRLRTFTDHGRIETLPARQARRYRAPVPAGRVPDSGTPRRAVMAGPQATGAQSRTHAVAT